MLARRLNSGSWEHFEVNLKLVYKTDSHCYSNVGPSLKLIIHIKLKNYRSRLRSVTFGGGGGGSAHSPPCPPDHLHCSVVHNEGV